MKFVQMTAIAAFALSLAAGSALAATAGVSVNGNTNAGVNTPAGNVNAGANASSNTNASTNTNSNNGPLGIDLSQAGTDANSQRTYFGTLTATQQSDISRHCTGMPVTTMSDSEKAFCEAIRK